MMESLSHPLLPPPPPPVGAHAGTSFECWEGEKGGGRRKEGFMTGHFGREREEEKRERQSQRNNKKGRRISSQGREKRKKGGERPLVVKTKR